MRTSACTAQSSTWWMSGLPPVVPTLPTLQLILWVPEDEQAKLRAHTLAALGDFFSGRATLTVAPRDRST
jgi:hypothetical protein